MPPTGQTRKVAEQGPDQRAPDYKPIGQFFPLYLAALHRHRNILNLIISMKLLMGFWDEAIFRGRLLFFLPYNWVTC